MLVVWESCCGVWVCVGCAGRVWGLVAFWVRVRGFGFVLVVLVGFVRACMGLGLCLRVGMFGFGFVLVVFMCAWVWVCVVVFVRAGARAVVWVCVGC